MIATTIEMQGTLQADGTLVLDEKPSLPPGRVRVVLHSDALERQSTTPNLNTAEAKSETDVSGSERFLDRVRQLEASGNEDDAIDLIFDTINTFLLENDFARCDSILGRIDVATIPRVLLIAFLTITAAAKSRLPSRSAFFADVNAAITRERGSQLADQLLRGLE
jgi:hypothetical protein